MPSTFRDDTRAIEGLPVRLVVAFVVGIASLSVMLHMLSGVGGLTVSELDVRPSPDVTAPGPQSVSLTVVDAGGDPVPDATVVVRSDTARIDGPVTARTDDSGRATVEVSPHLAPAQREGRLELSVKPPAGTQYVDRRANTAVLVLGD